MHSHSVAASVVTRDATSQGLTYAVAIGLGLSFSVFLLFLAWQNAFEAQKKEFTFESVLLREAVTVGVTAADDVTGSLASLLSSIGLSNRESFRVFVDASFKRHPYIGSVSYYPSLAALGVPNGQTVTGAASDFLAPMHIARDGGQRPPMEIDLVSDPRTSDAVQAALDSGHAIPSRPSSAKADLAGYVLLKTVSLHASPISPSMDPRDRGDPRVGLLVVAITADRLFRQASLSSDLRVSLYTESQGINGRQSVFSKRPDVQGGRPDWKIAMLSDETSTQFPHYSTKMIVEKPVYWGDLDKGLIYTAAVLGVGMSLLLAALARAKGVQARDLRERTREIERQVQRQTKELAVTRDQAVEASRVKSEFLASMSHEIRTPLNAIIGMAELLNDTKLSQVQRKYVGIFKKAGEALQSLVNDILDFSKIEAGQLELEDTSFNLRELIEGAVDIYALRADEKGIELLSHVAPDVPVQVSGDPGRLRQVVLNLLGNAIKFTEAGEIVVSLSCDPGNPGRIRFSVRDTGIGIPKDKLDMIFGSFSQLDSSTTRKYGGTGLGLAISKRLVVLMDGWIQVDSQLGRGSTFSFSIKLGRAPEPEPRGPGLEVDVTGKRILVIDDNATNRLILREMLKGHGALVSEAVDGPGALEAFRGARAKGATFELVITDCRMPGMDGFQVAEAIRAAGGEVDTVLMLTSSSLTDDMVKAQAIGMGAYLVKPVKSAELMRAVNQALSARPWAEHEPWDKTGEHTRPHQLSPILLVEDNEDNRLLVRAYLKRVPYEIDEAENGEIAVAKFKERRYSLVLMDVQMPIMDGHTATRAIRRWENEEGRPATPIIALTAHAIKEEMEKSKAAGCTTHLTKPIKKDTLLLALEPYLLLR